MTSSRISSAALRNFSSEIKFPKELEDLFKDAKKDGEAPILNAPELRNKPAGEKGKKYEEKIRKIMAAKRKREAEGN